MTDKTDALVARLKFNADVLDNSGTKSAMAATMRQAAEALAAPAEGGQGEVIDATSNPEYLRELALLLNQRGLSDAALPLPAIAAHYESLINSAGGAKVEPLTESYVQKVPDKCDRIIWREQYFHLPGLTPQPAEGDGAVAWRCVNGYSDCWGPKSAKCCPDCQHRTRPAATAAVPDAEAVLTEYCRICIEEHHEDAPRESRIEAMKRALAAAPAAPKGGVVDEAMVERAAQAISAAHLSNTGVPFPIEACRKDARIALTAALANQEQRHDALADGEAASG